MTLFSALLPRPLKGLIRRILHHAAALILRLRSVPYALTGPGCCIIIAPHPDDETLGCGGLIIRKRLLSLPVHVVYLTDGSASHPDHPGITPQALAQTRRKEARAAMKSLGMEDSALHFLDFQDGSLASLSPALAASLTENLAALFHALKPSEIFLPYRQDGSSEHDAAFNHVERAFRSLNPRPVIHEYPVWSWWNPLLTIRPMLRGSHTVCRLSLAGCSKQKRSALELYRSQTEAIPPWPSPVLSSEFLSFFSDSDEFYYRNQ